MSVTKTEPHKVLSWQIELMVEAGVAPDAAIRLAESGVSWHDVADLIGRGCPTYLVPVILAQG